MNNENDHTIRVSKSSYVQIGFVAAVLAATVPAWSWVSHVNDRLAKVEVRVDEKEKALTQRLDDMRAQLNRIEQRLFNDKK